MSQEKWENLADLFNGAQVVPGDEPVIPRAMYDEDGVWGIFYKFNGGNPRWFITSGPNAEDDEE